MLKRTIFVLVAALTLGGCAAAVKPSVEPSVAPPVAYPGRLLLRDHPQGQPSPILIQMTSDGRSRNEKVVVPKWDSWSGDVVSPDGTLSVTNSRGIMGIGGETVARELSAADKIGWPIHNPVFSPDSKRLEYTWSDTVHSNKLVVYDLAAKSDRVVQEAPCAMYTDMASGINFSSCGEIVAIWIDSTTLFVEYFAGPMPETAISGYEPGPNTFSIIKTDGSIVATGSTSSLGRSVSASGDTIVFDNGTWGDLKDMRAGLLQVAKPLPPGALPSCLSPDGSRIAVPPTLDQIGPWRLVDIRTGAVQELGTYYHTKYSTDGRCFWSPDGQFFAVTVFPQFAEDATSDPSCPECGHRRLLVVAASAAVSGGDVGSIGDWTELIGWLP